MGGGGLVGRGVGLYLFSRMYDHKFLRLAFIGSPCTKIHNCC